MSDEGLRAALDKMREEGVAKEAMHAFEHYYRQLEAGETGLMPEDSIDPVTDLPALEDLPDDAQAEDEALKKAIVLRLNGGLGHQHGPDGGEVSARGQGRVELPRRHRPPGARAALGARLRAAAAADGLLLHP